MKTTIAPTAASLASVAFAALAAGAVVPVARAAALFAPGPRALNLALFLCLAGYVLLIARLSGSGRRGLLAPLAILAAVLATAETTAGFVAPAAVALAWVRSGVCFPGPVWARLPAEILLVPVAIAGIAALKPPGPAGWALAVWLFFLIQAPYPLCFAPEARGAARPGIRVWLRPASARAAALRREQRLEQAFERLGPL
jgi:hypothetical protein